MLRVRAGSNAVNGPGQSVTDLLASAENPLAKTILRVRDGRRRDREGLVLAEGQRLISDLLAAGWAPEALLVREDLDPPPGWPALRRVSGRLLSRLSAASTPSGLLALFREPAARVPVAAQGGLVLAGVADPGNCGTLIRSAAAFAWGQVVICGGCDPYGTKAVQASAGALARVAVTVVDEVTLAGLLAGAPGCALVVEGGVEPGDLPSLPRWLVVGSEAHGVPADIRAQCREALTLPMPGGTESLNAAIAGAIALYALRGR